MAASASPACRTRGSILCLPSGVHGWEPANADALTTADFARVIDEAGDIEILLVGMGRELRPLPPKRCARR